MKRLSYLILIPCLLLSLVTIRAAENAQARLYSLSFKLYEATDISGDIMKISSTGAADNGLYELSPSQPPDSEITLPGMNSYGSGSSRPWSCLRRSMRPCGGFRA